MSIFESNDWLVRKITAALKGFTPPCREIARLLSDEMDRRLPLRKWLAIRLHCLTCIGCERYRSQLHFIHNVAKELPQHLDEISNEKLPGDIKNHIAEMLHNEFK